MVPQPRHIVIYIGNHPIEIGALRWQSLPTIHLAVGIGNAKRPMRRVRRHITEKWTLSVAFNKRHRLLKPDIGAVAIIRLFRAVSKVGIVKIVVTPVIRRLTDTAAAVVEGFFKPSVVRPERIIIAEVPFAEHAGFIAVAPENIRHRDFIAAEERAAADGMPHAGGVAVMPSHDAGARWGAGRPDV